MDLSDWNGAGNEKREQAPNNKPLEVRKQYEKEV